MEFVIPVTINKDRAADQDVVRLQDENICRVACGGLDEILCAQEASLDDPVL